MKIGLVLSGGAARGIAHIGVLKCLEEQNIKLCHLSGTSAGSIVGALYCAGIPMAEIEKIALDINWRDILKPTLPRIGLIDSVIIKKFVETHIGNTTFEELTIPLLVNAVDLVSGEEVIFNHGPVAQAVQASCAIPGIFSPVQIDNMLLVDGGLLNNVPVNLLKNQGIDEYILAVDINAQRPLLEEPRNIFDVLVQSFYITQKNRDLLNHYLADAVVEPVLGDISFWDITRAEELIRRGYDACCKCLEQNKPGKRRNRLLRWLRIP